MKITYVKNEERSYGGKNGYEVYNDGERIGYVRRGSSPVGYWGSWEGFIYGNKITSDSRNNVVTKGIELKLWK